MFLYQIYNVMRELYIAQLYLAQTADSAYIHSNEE